MRVYLDNAATTPLAPEVLEAMMPFMTRHFGNPSAQHSYGRETRAAIEQARKSVAGHLKAKASEIVFTSGGTESNNLALAGAVRDLGVKRIITSPVEHHCVLHTVEYLRTQHNLVVEFLQVNPLGQLDLDQLEGILAGSKEKTLVSLMHANNEIGTLHDLEAIARICISHDAYFHSDTVQTMAHYRFDLEKIPVHFLTGSAHKFHGPKGVGFLFTRKGLNVHPLIHGGGQERNKRAGTENVYGIVGLAKAMDLAYENLSEEMRSVQGLKAYFLKQLRISMEDVQVNGPEDPALALYTVLNVSFPPADKGPLLLFNLDMEGVAASGGSACTSGASLGSHVIQALGHDPARISARFSFSKYNTREELDFALGKIKKVFNVEAVI
jgi:cysteine desulfurase